MNCVKLPVNFFEIDIVKEIEQEECGNEIIVFYLKMLLKAKQRKDNKYCIAKDFELTYKNISWIFKTTEEKCKLFLEILKKHNLVIVENWYIEVLEVWKLNPRNRSSVRYKKWRDNVFKRDNYTCQHCGIKGHYIEAHHIVRWVDSLEKRYDEANGITLCKACHKKEHSKNKSR